MMKKFSYLLMVLLISSIGYSTSLKAKAFEADSLALVEIYKAGDGEKWEWVEERPGIEWFTGPMKDWKYIVVNDEGRVTNLTLNHMNMGGTLSPAIGQLTELTRFEIQGWEKEMKYIDLAGELPAELWNCTKLTRIQLKFTRMTGELPAGIEKLQVLEEFNTQATKFSGQIPSELFNIPTITKLYLHQSAFEGDIPATLSNATKLVRFYVHENQLTGLPFVALETPGSAKIELTGNFFSFSDLKPYYDAHGLTPYGNLSNTYQYAKQPIEVEVAKGVAYTVNGAVDNAEGYAWFKPGSETPFAFEAETQVVLEELPEEGAYVCKAQSSMAPGCEIRTIYNLSMDITASERDELALKEIYKAGDGEKWEWVEERSGIEWFTGPMKDWKYIVVNDEGRVTNLTLNHMNMGGTLSPAIGQLTELTRFEIQGWEKEMKYVDLAGELPAELWNCTKLTRIQLKFTRMTGELPAGIEKLQVLEEFNTQATKFSGQIPSELFNIPTITKLYLHQSAFEGDIPATLSNATKLVRFYVHENQLTGLPFVALETPGSAKIELTGNFFSFADVKPYHDAHVLSPYGNLSNTYQYAQKDVHINTEVGSSETLQFDNPIDGAEMYAWFKGEGETPISLENSYSIASVSGADQGTYLCRIQSSLVGNFELRAIFHVNAGVTSIGEIEKDLSVNVFPNPVVDLLSVKSENLIKRVIVSDPSGRVVLAMSSINSSEAFIQFSSFRNGLYLISVETDEGYSTFKIIKK
jgi:hypothetical protein